MNDINRNAYLFFKINIFWWPAPDDVLISDSFRRCIKKNFKKINIKIRILE